LLCGLAACDGGEPAPSPAPAPAAKVAERPQNPRIGAAPADRPPFGYEGREPVEPLPPPLLLDFLPEVLGPWKRAEIDARVVPQGEASCSLASAVYRDESGLVIAVQVVDGAYVPGLYMGFRTMWETKLDTPEVAYERLSIAGEPAVEIRSRSRVVHTQIAVLAGGRHVTTMEGERVDGPTLRDFAARIAFEKLAQLR
jgi:hypothetical protein